MPLPEAYWRLSKLFSTKVTFEERGLIAFSTFLLQNYKNPLALLSLQNLLKSITLKTNNMKKTLFS